MDDFHLPGSVVPYGKLFSSVVFVRIYTYMPALDRSLSLSLCGCRYDDRHDFQGLGDENRCRKWRECNTR